MGEFNSYFVKLYTLHGYTKAELARISGVSEATLSRIEAGTQKPSPNTLAKLAPHLHVSYTELMERANYLTPSFPSEKSQPLETKQPKDLAKFLNEAEIMFDGELYDLDDQDREMLRKALEFTFWQAKEKNKRKKS